VELNFRKIVDLTQVVADGMPVYPGDPPVRITEVAHHDPDGFAVAALHLNDHAGTHIETLYHMFPGRQLIDEPPERFIGRASVVPVPGGEIRREHLEPFEAFIRRNPFALLATGYADRVRVIDPTDPDRPVVSLRALEWLCDRGAQLLGIDAFDFDSGPPYPGHRLLFERGVLVVEGLVGLSALAGQEITLLVLPLKLAGTGASLCRALALVR
jgi:kynurenine formamidase